MTAFFDDISLDGTAAITAGLFPVKRDGGFCPFCVREPLRRCWRTLKKQKPLKVLSMKQMFA